MGAAFVPTNQVLLSKNFHSRPGCRRKILSKEIWGWGWGSKFEPQIPLHGSVSLVVVVVVVVVVVALPSLLSLLQKDAIRVGGMPVCHPLRLPILRQEKRAQRLTFWVRRPPGGVGAFRAKGWWPKSSCPPSKVCLPWVSTRLIWDVPGILPGCPGPLGVFKKFVQKSSCAFFVP